MIRVFPPRKTHTSQMNHGYIRDMGKTKRYQKHAFRNYGKGHEYGFGRSEEVHKPKQGKKERKGNRKQQEKRAVREGWY